MKKIAVCVPTNNHPLVVNDVLKKSIDLYSEFGIDIYYYDSSEDNATKEIIESFQKKGYNNLFYIKAPYNLSIKTTVIFCGKELQKKYDYIWLVKDRSFCPKETLIAIIKETEKIYNIIFLAAVHKSSSTLGTKTYYDVKNFYADWAWLATSIDTTIYRYDSMLADFSFEENKPMKYDSYEEDPWYHYFFLFKKLAQKNDVQIRSLGDNDIKIYNSSLGKSDWEKSVFNIWKDCWIAVNENLPICYNEHKASVIKEAATLPWILGGIQRLCDLHKKGILRSDNYDEIIQNWEMVSDIPRHIVKDIAFDKYDSLHDLYQIAQNSSRTVEIITKFIELIKENKAHKQQIPIGDIAECVYTEISEKCIYSAEQLNIIKGSILDIKNICLLEETSNEKLCTLLQMFISFLIMLK